MVYGNDTSSVKYIEDLRVITEKMGNIKEMAVAENNLVSVAIRADFSKENEDIYAPIRTYALINDKRFAIFPVLENENIIEKKFVQTNQSMQIYLLAKYDEKEFQEEKMRLYNPSDGNHAWPIYNDDKFYYIVIISTIIQIIIKTLFSDIYFFFFIFIFIF